MFDVFYINKKPEIFAHERQVKSVEEAQSLSRTRFFWLVTYLADLTEWDWLYEPKPWEAHQRHAWPSQWQKDSGVYLVPTAGYTDTNYHSDKVIHRNSSKDPWVVHEAIDDAWDWSWHPDPAEPPYIYVWGNQWNFPEDKASVEYHVPGATERKYMEQRTQRLPNYGNQWRVLLNVEDFDYSWEPNPFDPAYIYVFGNQWYSAELEPTVEYHVPGATERKYVPGIIARVQSSTTHYYQHCAIESFDYSWHPDPGEPPYIYVFGNQWYSAEIMPTVEYSAGNATERKYMDYPRAQLPQRHNNHWHTIENCNWDYSWIPDPGDPPYIYVFGNQHWPAEIMPTVTYTVPGATERKYMDYPRAQLLETHQHWHNISDHKYEFDRSWTPDPGEPPMVYVFGNQHWPAEKMPMLSYCSEPNHKNLPVKYVDYPRAKLLPNKTLWKLPQGVREEQVDFSWVPDPGEPPYIYQFATQHQKTGGPQYHVPDATEIKYLEHVEIVIETATVPVVEIDHLDGNAGNIPNTIKRIRYFDNYRDTLIRLAKSLVGEHEFVWVCSSVCDYTGFDFSWHPEKWQGTMLHVFASNDQKFGDTFYMHVPTFAARAEKKALLEWYSVNYVPRKIVPRHSMPVIEHTGDSQVDAVKNTDWPGPLALFTTHGMPLTIPAVSLWRAETKTVMSLSPGASAVIVPKAAKAEVKTQMYDYAYIDKTQTRRHSDRPLDIVFISNGENDAETLYQHLVNCVGGNLYTQGDYRIKRVKNVNGRVAAYQAAANASRTPWFFAVFAKLQVNDNFDWNWQPDRMQQPKHYIFHAYNPINHLTYGHQAMIAYNKQLALTNTGEGLDFTLDQPHEVVPILSGQANYYTNDWMCWRTAFREALKLRASLPDVENEYRLNQWLTVDHGKAPQWSSRGAQDAVEYYEEVKGDFAALKKSYEWGWLASYAFIKHGLVAT